MQNTITPAMMAITATAPTTTPMIAPVDSPELLDEEEEVAGSEDPEVVPDGVSSQVGITMFDTLGRL